MDSARCVAHGADPSFVGLTLSAVLARTGNDAVAAEALHRRFIAAAESGGGWVTYEWRNSPDSPLALKGAYVLKLRASWGTCYSGVGYVVTPPAGALRSQHISSGAADGPSAAVGAAMEEAAAGGGVAAGKASAGARLCTSRAAAKAAAAGLERRLRGVEQPDSMNLPAELEAVLREHATRHLKRVDRHLLETPLSPSVAALVGYNRRHPEAVALAPSPTVAALVGYDRVHRCRTPVDWGQEGAGAGAGAGGAT